MNLTPANIFELNQICDTFNNLHHIHFPQVAGGRIGAPLSVHTFAYSSNRSNTRDHKSNVWCENQTYGWILAGEYETSECNSQSFRIYI